MTITLVSDEAWGKQFVEWVLQQAESPRLETKRVSGKMVHKAIETICAFANSSGGWLVLGMEDASKASGQARCIGVEENPEAIDELLRKIPSQILPTIAGVRALRIPCKLASGEIGVRGGHPSTGQRRRPLGHRGRNLDARTSQQSDHVGQRNQRAVLSKRCSQRGVGARGCRLRASGNRYLAPVLEGTRLGSHRNCGPALSDRLG